MWKVAKGITLILCGLGLLYLLGDIVLGAQHCITVEVKKTVAYVSYSSPDSLGAIVTVLDFDGCAVEKVKWEKPGTKLDVVCISGSQVSMLYFGTSFRVPPGQGVGLATIHLLNTGQGRCEVDTFTNGVGTHTCMVTTDAKVIECDVNLSSTDVPGDADEYGITPSKFCMNAYPNPFNPSMMIKYNVPKGGPVKIAVYNLLGQEVTCLTDSEHDPGTYYIVWSTQQASGTYFVKMSASGFSESRKVVLLK